MPCRNNRNFCPPDKHFVRWLTHQAVKWIWRCFPLFLTTYTLHNPCLGNLLFLRRLILPFGRSQSASRMSMCKQTVVGAILEIIALVFQLEHKPSIEIHEVHIFVQLIERLAELPYPCPWLSTSKPPSHPKSLFTHYFEQGCFKSITYCRICCADCIHFGVLRVNLRWYQPLAHGQRWLDFVSDCLVEIKTMNFYAPLTPMWLICFDPLIHPLPLCSINIQQLTILNWSWVHTITGSLADSDAIIPIS